MNPRVRIVVPAALVSVLALTALPAAGSESDGGQSPLGKINHIVVIYQENHSFDNLYGGWEGVNGLASADAAHTLQIKQDGSFFACLLQNDVNLANKLPASCNDTSGTPATTTTPANYAFTSHFTNAPFQIDAYIPASAHTCPQPGAPFSANGYPDNPSNLAGGCTRDIVHRFYQEQYQLNGGQQNRYTAGSDAVGLTQGYYDSQADPNPGLACGDRAVNTIQPTYQPTSSNPIKLPPQTATTIGDELSSAGVSWAWYAGGWSNAAGNIGAPGWTNGAGPGCADPYSAANPSYPYCPNKVFQFHHQPFNYFANYAPGTTARDQHLRDEAEFMSLAQTSTNQTCNLSSVSFVKPIGLENEHPGYTSETAGSSHLVELLKAIDGSACRKDTLVVTTYDEFVRSSGRTLTRWRDMVPLAAE